ncbi:MAG TPA: hypothetical protein VJY35_05910 [Candidatus Eisenbacteria bacterium]|nr:hypothetical protein [Candidatus Eisenbacteria bacterium]
MAPRALFCLAPLVLAASISVAGPAPPVIVIPFTGPRATPPPGGPIPAACTLVYSNYEGVSPGAYVAGAGKEVIDDLHLAATGILCGFGFTYITGSGTPFDVITTFYANDGPFGGPGTVIGGPFLSSVPGGSGTLTSETPGAAVTIGPDLWMGVQFLAEGMGLFLNNPPSIGSSADLFYQRPEEAFMNFGGSPVANFMLRVEVDTPTPVRPATWGSLKTIYRD